MIRKLVLDIETQKTFDEIADRTQLGLLKVSLVGVYYYPHDKYYAFEEHQIPELERLLLTTDLIIGFNIRRFDYPVIQPYLSAPIQKFETLDIMEEFQRANGHRISLEALSQATLGEGKSGSGLDAIRFYREGRIEELKRYCLDDVRLTRQLYEIGLTKGQLTYTEKDGSARIWQAGWKQAQVPAGGHTQKSLSLFD